MIVLLMLGQDPTLRIAERGVPERFSPALAWTEPERMALDFVFEPLLRPAESSGLGRRYVPVLARPFAAPGISAQAVYLRKDRVWSDGEKVTAADVRHTAQLLAPSGFPWRDLLELPRWEGDPFRLDLIPRQTTYDSLGWWTFPILPSQARGKPLFKADDVEFSRRPIGSGPFVVSETLPNEVVWTPNSHVKSHLGEIRWQKWPDGAPMPEPPPHLVLDPDPDRAVLLTKAGYAIQNLGLSPRLTMLAINHRSPILQNPNFRRFLALALDRQKILDKVYPPLAGDSAPSPLRGPFPAVSWANCPPPRVPASLHQTDLAKTLARELPKTLGPVQLTLKVQAGDARLIAAVKEMTAQWQRLGNELGWSVSIAPTVVQPGELHEDLLQHRFELALTTIEGCPEVFAAWPWLDPAPDALKPGGSNILGYENDAKLTGLLRTPLQHRDFMALTEAMHNLHAHLHETMPFIPLWQLPRVWAVHPDLRLGEVDRLHPFAKVAEWKVRKK